VPDLQVTFMHRGDDGKLRRPGETVPVSDDEARRRVGYGHGVIAAPTELEPAAGDGADQADAPAADPEAHPPPLTAAAG
jgi:hypothetical protein